MSTPILAPNSTWFRPSNTSIARSSITEINIVDSYTPTGSETAFWDASAANDGSVMCYVNGTKLTIAGNGSGKVFANADSSFAFSDSNRSDYFSNVTAINNAELFDTTNAATFQRLFESCSKLTSVNVSDWNTGNVTTMHTTFSQCLKLSDVDVSNWKVDKVTDMTAMFQRCTSLTSLDLSKWNVGNVDSMYLMFGSITDLPMQLVSIGDTSAWNVSNVTNFAGMFQTCAKLETLDVANWNVSKVKNFQNMFDSCTSLQNLDVSNWSTSSAENMSFMFYKCTGPGSIDVSGWDVSKVKTFDHMFAHSYLDIGDTSEWNISTECTNLNGIFHTVQNTTLDVSGFDTSKVTAFTQMFENCTKLTEIVGLEKLDTSSGLGFSEMFANCSSLPKLNLSSFDTRKAKDGVKVSTNGGLSKTLYHIFHGMNKLEKVTLGANFSFNGDGTTTVPENIAILPTPNPEYVLDATGYWYTEDGSTYSSAEIPSMTANTYYAYPRVNKNYIVSGSWITDLSRAIRKKANISEKLTTDEMIEAINNLSNIDVDEYIDQVFLGGAW